jgi:cell division protein FtsB
MKQKPKTSLTVQQRKRLLRIALSVIVIAFVWLAFAPGRGMFHLHQQSKHLAALEAESQKLVQHNSDISRDIERLQSDDEYLEQVAREEHGMLKDNEMVFDFSKKKKK